MDTFISILHQLGTLAFWQNLFHIFEGLGPLPGILLAMMESFVPALPLTAIAVLNVSAHGFMMGFVYTWLGSCIGCTIAFLFFRHVYGWLAVRLHFNMEKVEKARAWLSEFDTAALFLLLCLPFTPSSFMNFAFGVSDFPRKKYLCTMFLAKVFMIGTLSYFGDSVSSVLSEPWKFVICLAAIGLLYLISLPLRRRHKL